METGVGKGADDTWRDLASSVSCMNNIISVAERVGTSIMCVCDNESSQKAIGHCDKALGFLKGVDIVNIADYIENVEELKESLKNPKWKEIIKDAAELSKALAKERDALGKELGTIFSRSLKF